MKVIVFDTETTGLSKNDHIVSICWIVYNNGEETYRYSCIIKPLDYTIPQVAINIHGITNEIANAKGVDILYILHMFNESLGGVDMVIGHNLSFDIRMIKQEMVRHSVKMNTVKFQSCTMKMGKPITNIQSFNKNGKPYVKNPKLIELYQYIFGKGFDGQHNAIEDTIACARCYFNMKGIKMIQKKVTEDDIFENLMIGINAGD